jgi:hypothetical protein
MRPLRYRIVVLGATSGFIASTAAQLVSASYFPMNYIVEALPVFTGVDSATICTMRGAVAS